MLTVRPSSDRPRDPDVHPEPRRRRVEPRAGADPRLRAVHHPRHRRSRSGSASGAGSRAAASPGEVSDLAIWAVPFGLVGGRLYHVITDWRALLRRGPQPGHRAVRLARRPGRLGGDRPRRARAVASARGPRGIKMLPLIDALAPGVLVAQAIGRWGNWFNQELYGRPTDLPWGLEIDAAHRPAQYLDAGDVPPDVPLRVRCGTWRRSPCSSGSTAASASVTAGWPRSTSCSTRSAAAGSRTSASTTCSWTT